MSNAAYFTANSGANTFFRWKQSQQLSLSDYGGQHEIIESYLIAKTVTATGIESLIDFNGADLTAMQAAGVVPYMGGTYGSDWAGTSNVSTNKHRCRSIEFEIMPANKTKCTIHWTSYWSHVPGDALGKQLMPASIEYQSSLRTMTRYRHNITVEPSATLDVSTADIGGDPVALYGIFATTTVPQLRIRIRLIRDALVTNVSSMSDAITTILNTKNTDTFLGYTAGMLLCEGASMIHLGGNYYEIIFEILADAYYRHEQVPKYNNDGTVAMTADNATEVKWKRQKSVGSAFAGVWFGDDGAAPSLEYITKKGYWSTY